MFIGHFAVGLAAKEAAPKVSLGTLVLSVQLLDLMWPILLILGLEHVRLAPGITAFTPLDFYDYPISHSLLTVVCWAGLFGIIYYAVRRYSRGAWILAAGVLSHWVLDFISHRPDMPLAPGISAYVGLGLSNSVPATIVIEFLLFTVGVFLYARTTIARNRTGTVAFWCFTGFLVLFWLASIMSPPPSDVSMLGWGGLALWLFVPWGYWIDRYRMPRTAE